MNRNVNRQEALRIAAEKMRLKKEKEEREDKEFYEKITSGTRMLIFKIVVVFCSLMALVSTYEVLVDGPSRNITEADWKVDRYWEWTWHKIIDVEGGLYAPTLNDWTSRIDSTMQITYSPIFRTGKKLVYDIQVTDNIVKEHEEIRWRSIFTWFPTFQLFLLIPLVTFIFKRQKPWFNFARMLSLFVVFPGSLFVLFYAML